MPNQNEQRNIINQDDLTLLAEQAGFPQAFLLLFLCSALLSCYAGKQDVVPETTYKVSLQLKQQKPTQKSLETLKKTLLQKLKQEGFSKTSIAIQKQQLKVQLKASHLDLIKRIAYRLQNHGKLTVSTPGLTQKVGTNKKETLLLSKFDEVKPSLEAQRTRFSLYFKLRSKDAQRFSKLTQAYVGKTLVFKLNRKTSIQPVIKAPITGGLIRLQLRTKYLAHLLLEDVLDAGSLPSKVMVEWDS